MREMVEQLNLWLSDLEKSKLPIFDDLPDVSLYMDQIVSYIDTVLKPYGRDEQKLITSFMVNNYVKAKIIDAPHLKRYDKNQVSYLIAICLLKQITSMSNLAVLLNKDNFDESGELYNHFVELHDETKNAIEEKARLSLEKVLKGGRISSKGKSKRKTNVDDEPEVTSDSQIRKNLIDLSLKLMIESEINKIISERILYEIGKETYNNPDLFEEKHKELKFDNKKSKKEAKRIKKVNSR